MKFKLNRKTIIISLFFLAITIGVIVRIMIPKPLIVISSNPALNQTHNPFLPLEVTFNRSPKENDIFIDLNPSASFSASYQDNKLTITPQTQFDSFTNYILTLNTDPVFILKFTTQSDISNPPGWNEMFNQSFSEYQAEFGTQDKALSEIRQNVPIKQADFTLDYAYKNNTYTITLKSPYTSSKQNFIDWFEKQGVTDLTNIRLKYVNQ